MLYEEKNLVPSEKEKRLQIYTNQLINDLHKSKKIEVNSIDLLILLSYLTSDNNISSEMKTATEICNRNIIDILHKKEIDKLKNEIKYMEKNYIPNKKISKRIKELEKEAEQNLNWQDEIYYAIGELKNLLEVK